MVISGWTKQCQQPKKKGKIKLDTKSKAKAVLVVENNKVIAKYKK